MRIARNTRPITKFYTIGGHVLDEADKGKYLGVTVSNDLSWSSHVAEICKKSNNTLSFLKRNLKSCPEPLRETAYFTLVRSVIEYGCTVWDPHLKRDINALERIQNQAAHFVKNDFSYQSSVTRMLADLGWDRLEERRRELRLTIMFKIVHGLIKVPSTDILVPADTRTRSNHPYKYKQIRANTEEYRNSFFPRSITDWNHLEEEAVVAKDTDNFKEHLSHAHRKQRPRPHL